MKVGDLIVESKELQNRHEDLPVLTLTERNGFVYQADRFNKRLATTDTSKYKVVRYNDIAFNPYLLWAGAIAQNSITARGIISPLYPTFRVRDDHDPAYVGRLLSSPLMIHSYDNIAFGSVPRRRRTSVVDFLNLPVPKIPTLFEQERITEILKHAELILEQRGRYLDLLQGLEQSIFHQMFGEAEHYVTELSSISEISSGITKGRQAHEPTVAVPYLAVANVQSGYLDLKHVKTIEATEKEIGRYKLEDGDLILTEGGDPDKLGRGTVWRGELPLCIHQNHIFKVRPNAMILSDYLSAYLASSQARRYFMRAAKQTTGIASINMTQLRATPVPVPSLKKQQQFVAYVEQVSKNLDIANLHRVTASELFASLQARAFNK